MVKEKTSLEAMFKSSFEQITKLLTIDSKEMTPTAKLRKCERDLAAIFHDCKPLHDDIVSSFYHLLMISTSLTVLYDCSFLLLLVFVTAFQRIYMYRYRTIY